MRIRNRLKLKKEGVTDFLMFLVLAIAVLLLAVFI